jgi:hypothetical protein
MGTDYDHKSKKPKAQRLQGLTENESFSATNKVQTLDVDSSEASRVAGAVEVLTYLSQSPSSSMGKRKQRVPQTQMPHLLDVEETQEYSYPVYLCTSLCKSMKEHSDSCPVCFCTRLCKSMMEPILDLQHSDTESYSLPSNAHCWVSRFELYLC